MLKKAILILKDHVKWTLLNKEYFAFFALWKNNVIESSTHNYDCASL
ncbi:hypothetical protein [[Mycoplasma] falconis]|nr:hypothetical protein [[Mycoplasma] falconis]